MFKHNRTCNGRAHDRRCCKARRRWCKAGPLAALALRREIRTKRMRARADRARVQRRAMEGKA